MTAPRPPVGGANDAAPEVEDGALVAAARAGSRAALEALVVRHQAWIYNVAYRMVGRVEDARDVTQDVLIKMITGLATFRGESAFRTWLYRIVANHVINMKQRPREYPFSSFERHGRLIDHTPNLEPDEDSLPIDAHLLVEETKVGCMMGMLLCLDRSQRLTFVLSAILGASSAEGGAIMGVSPAAFRQTLSRARTRLGNFMNEKCGLMRPENSCRCRLKVQTALNNRYIDPQRLRVGDGKLPKISEVAAQCVERVEDLLEKRTNDLFREHPFLRAPDCVQAIAALLAVSTPGIEAGE
jgi:RNA polymerase sigma factor (sigma-70 family)